MCCCWGDHEAWQTCQFLSYKICSKIGAHSSSSYAVYVGFLLLLGDQLLYLLGCILLRLALLHPALVSAKERSTQLCVMGCEGVDECSVVYRCGSVSGRCAHVVTVPALL